MRATGVKRESAGRARSAARKCQDFLRHLRPAEQERQVASAELAAGCVSAGRDLRRRRADNLLVGGRPQLPSAPPDKVAHSRD